MKLSTVSLLIAFAVTLLAVKPLVAHHSFDAEYDSKKPITVSGVVTKLDWVNPHAFVYIDTKDERRGKALQDRDGTALRARPRWLEARHRKDRRQRYG